MAMIKGKMSANSTSMETIKGNFELKSQRIPPSMGPTTAPKFEKVD